MEKLDPVQLARWEDMISRWIDRHILVYASEEVIKTLKLQSKLWKLINSLPVK